MQTVRLTINGHIFEVWLASKPDERTKGLMYVTEEELATIPGNDEQGIPDVHRGMLFVFRDELPLSFWMMNTVTPLDIAYIREDGIIGNIYTMAPLETRTYPSTQPAKYALEVKAGLFDDLGIKLSDRVEIPDSVLKIDPD